MNTLQKSAASRSLVHFRIYFFITIASALAVTLIGCDEDSTGSGSDEFNIQITNTQAYGEVLADGEGNVLYYFTPDVEGESLCEGNCAGSWPIFLAGELTVGADLEVGDFAIIARSDGSSQTTYFGWPLYYFAGDNQAGDTNGDAIESFGGIWYVAKADYSVVNASQQLVGHDGNNYTANATEGEGITTHFTDINGRTIYIFAFDSANTNNFTAEDFSNNAVWPIFHVDLSSLPSTLDNTLFAEIMVHGEQPQLTYNGWPLYYFGEDSVRGDTKGVSFPRPGIWPVARQEIAAAPGL
jgi:predicted lipoprotein with Yx(FWY)xxD motif